MHANSQAHATNLCCVSRTVNVRSTLTTLHTGRRRQGRIIMLLAEGKEQEVYKRSLSTRKSIFNVCIPANLATLSCNIVFFFTPLRAAQSIVKDASKLALYQQNARMVPGIFRPECKRVHIVPGDYSKASLSKRKSKQQAYVILCYLLIAQHDRWYCLQRRVCLRRRP